MKLNGDLKMLQNKNSVDKYFLDNWHTTPISFDLENFTMPADKKWIGVQLIPYDRKLIGFDGQHGRKIDYALIRVRCYDTTVTKSYNLAYQVQKMLECKTIPNADGTQLQVELGVGTGDGSLDMENSVFRTTLDFKVTKYNKD